MARVDRFRTGPSFDDRATGKFSGSPPGWRGSNRQPGIETANTRRSYATPSNRQPGISQANVRPRTGSTWIDRVGNLAKGAANTGKKIGQGIMHPAMLMAGSITQNRADHDYLDEVFGKNKGSHLWKQAMDNYYTDVPAAQINPSISQYGVTDTGTSFGQARKYFQKHGITDNALEKFLGVVPSKWKGNEAWLEAQGGDSPEDFRTGMSFIKNAKATANLRRSTEAARNQLADESLPYRSGIEQEGGAPRSYPIDDVSIDITEDLYGMYPGPEEDVLWGEPGTQQIRPEIKPKPDIWRNVPEPGIPGRPDLSPPDPYGGMYESPLTDMTYGEQLVDTTPQLPFHAKHKYLPRDTHGIEQMGGGRNALPLGGITKGIAPNYGNPEYFEQYYPDITVEFGEEEDATKGRWGKGYNQFR